MLLDQKSKKEVSLKKQDNRDIYKKLLSGERIGKIFGVTINSSMKNYSMYISCCQEYSNTLDGFYLTLLDNCSFS